MARVRPLRPRSVRFVREQAAIEQWTALALDAARLRNRQRRGAQMLGKKATQMASAYPETTAQFVDVAGGKEAAVLLDRIVAAVEGRIEGSVFAATFE